MTTTNLRTTETLAQTFPEGHRVHYKGTEYEVLSAHLGKAGKYGPGGGSYRRHDEEVVRLAPVTALGLSSGDQAAQTISVKGAAVHQIVVAAH